MSVGNQIGVRVRQWTVGGMPVVILIPMVLISSLQIWSGLGLLVGLLALVVGASVALDARVRVVVVVFGGMFVLQSSYGVAKNLYLLVVVFAVGRACLREARHPSVMGRAFVPMFWVGGLFTAYILLSALWAIGNGATFDAYFRDALPYMMLATFPMIALDVSKDVSVRFVQIVIALAGLYGAAAFAVLFLSRRGISALPIDSIGVSATPLCAFVFCYALSYWRGQRKYIWWGVLATVIPTLLLVTGTRNTLVFSAGIVGLIGSRKLGNVPVLRVVGMCVAVVAAAGLLIPLLVQQLSSDPGYVGARLNSLLSVDGLAQTDQSYWDRSRQYGLALGSVERFPIVGTGPGYPYLAYAFNEGASRTAFTLDTPLVSVAKLGILGALLIAAFIAAACFTSRRVRNIGSTGPTTAAGRSFLFVLVAMLPFGAAVENKTTAMAVMLLLLAQLVHADINGAASRPIGR